MKKVTLLLTLALSLFLAGCNQPTTSLPNKAPVLSNPGNQTSIVNSTVNLQLEATDPEGDSLSFSAAGLPEGLAISKSGLITGSPTTEGTTTVSVSVEDAKANKASDTFTWLVTANSTPIVETFTGSAYTYDSLKGGKCSFGIDETNLDVVSINTKQFGIADLCGARIEVKGDKGSKTLLIADQLITDEENAISMPRATLAEIVTTIEGAKVEWKLSFPENIGLMSYELKDVDPNGFTALLVKNHLTPISKVECRAPGETSEFKSFKRTENSANFFWGPGFGGGNITCKITDSFGAVVEEKDIPAPAGASSHAGTQQFPAPSTALAQ